MTQINPMKTQRGEGLAAGMLQTNNCYCPNSSSCSGAYLEVVCLDLQQQVVLAGTPIGLQDPHLPCLVVIPHGLQHLLCLHKKGANSWQASAHLA